MVTSFFASSCNVAVALLGLFNPPRVVAHAQALLCSLRLLYLKSAKDNFATLERSNELIAIVRHYLFANFISQRKAKKKKKYKNWDSGDMKREAATQTNATVICQPFFSVKPSSASFATDASSGVSNKTCAIFPLWPAAFAAGTGATWVD